MSKVSNVLNMYFLLQSRGLMGLNELSEELEIGTRMIKEYKNDLEKAGVYIGSKRGKYGGYYIDNRASLDGLSLVEEEISALKMAKETIKSGKYHYSLKFETLISKILYFQRDNQEVTYHNKILSESEEIIKKEKQIWLDINTAIKYKKKVKMDYKSLKQDGIEINEREVDPYGVFSYKGATYFYGYCNKAKNIRFFKLSRVVKYTITEEEFDIKVDFDFDEVMGKTFGIYNDHSVELKLKIYYPMSEIIKEKQICKDQKIIEIDEKTIIFEAKMKGYTEIMTWVLGMGSSVEVLEPINLKEDLMEEINKTRRRYL